MDIKELNKTQLILLTLLITFVVSIATGIVTVSLMQQMPKSVPQTINNVIQRTIEKVSVPTPQAVPVDTKTTGVSFGDGDVLVPLYTKGDMTTGPTAAKPLGQGVIVSDVGLLLVDETLLTDKDVYTVVLNGGEYDATILKKFSNGFVILKITKKSTTPDPVVPQTQDPTPTPNIDNKQ